MSHEAIVKIPLDKLVHGEHSSRYEDRNGLTGLALSLQSCGQIQPIRVRRLPDGDQYEILVGGRRALALRMARKSDADCIVVDKQLSEAETIRLRWSENAQRVGLNPMEDARLVCRFLDASGLNGTEAAKELGVSMTEVSRCRERVHEWCEELKALVESGKVPASTGHVIHKIDDPEKKREALTRAAAGQLTRDAASAEVRQCAVKASVLDSPAPGTRPVRLSVKLDEGAVTISGRTLSADAVVSLLAQLLSRARKLRTRGLDATEFCRAMRGAVHAHQGAPS